MTSFAREVVVYARRVNEFSPADWKRYLAWVGLMTGLLASTGAFVIFGTSKGVAFPAVAWLVPVGVLVFTLSIALDTVGHLTIYKEAIAGAEDLVHSVTIFFGISSVVVLCAAYTYREALWIPALVLTVLSFVYSFVDEAFHWKRYVQQNADRVEMASHAGILTGHSIMMIAWWTWFYTGYEGVAETIRAF